MPSQHAMQSDAARSDRSSLLWVDLRPDSGKASMADLFHESCALQRLGRGDDITAAINAFAPDVICFDFDAPSAADLNVLQETKLRHTSLPIIMFSETSSSELAIWALRARVWDYFIKPVCVGEVMRRLCILSRITSDQRQQGKRSVYLPQRMQFHVCSESVDAERTQVAVEYLAAHYDEKVTLECAARICAMGPFEFSRAFKREQGQTFRDYLIALRINAAAALLSGSSLSVLDIAFRVGFNDSSHLARTFRRQTGVTPTAYRAKHNSAAALAGTDARIAQARAVTEGIGAMARLGA